MPGKSIVIGATEVPPGSKETVELAVANLYTHTHLTMPVHIVNGRRDGPTLFLTAAIHGDELNGITFNAVGAGTVVENVQMALLSYANDIYRFFPAAAGLHRLDVHQRIGAYLDAPRWLPAAGQGATRRP